MVASLFQLDHGFAAVAALPAAVFGRSDERGRVWVVGALTALVVFVVAGGADAGLAALAEAVFS